MTLDFLKLMECLTNENLTGNIVENKDFEEVVGKIESIFNPSNQKKMKLDSNKVCSIAASGDKFKYVILGLNPHDDGEVEEINNIPTWEELAEYHTPSNLYGNNTFTRVLSGKVSKYYQNIAVLINSLNEGRFIKWSEFRNGDDKEKTREKYLNMIETSSIAVAELIPFASEKFGAVSKKNLEKLLNEESRILKYLHTLITLIQEKTYDDGWIICNGKNACEAFQIILGTEGFKKDLNIILDMKEVGKYSLHYLDGKKVLMLHEFLRRQNGALNSNEQIENMINKVISSL